MVERWLVRNKYRGLTATILAVFAGAFVLAACTPRVQPVSEFSGPASFVGDALRTSDGIELPMRVWSPDAAASDTPLRAVVLALHGFNDYSGSFQSPAAYLKRRGIAVYAYDQRGYGGAPHRGVWPDTDALRQDAQSALRLLRARHPEMPLLLMGHSMGGAVAMMVLAEGPEGLVDGAILVSPGLLGWRAAPAWKAFALRVGAHVVPWIEVSTDGLDYNISDNEAMLLALRQDPMMQPRTRLDKVYGLVGLMDAAWGAADTVRGPLLVLYGINDTIIPCSVVREVYDRLPGDNPSQRRLAVYANGWHELLRDLQAEVVWKDVATWIGNRGSTLPSGAEVLSTEHMCDRN